jgi:hypothetical protein
MNTILATLILAFAIVLLIIAGMSIGVMNGRRPISGSCGGLNNGRCELCSGNCRKGEDT